MAREYVTNVGKVPPSKGSRETGDRLPEEGAGGYLDGTMRSDDGRNMVRATLSMYTDSPCDNDDLAKMFMVFRAGESPWLRPPSRRSPKLEGKALLEVLDQLKALKAKNADAIPLR